MGNRSPIEAASRPARPLPLARRSRLAHRQAFLHPADLTRCAPSLALTGSDHALLSSHHIFCWTNRLLQAVQCGAAVALRTSGAARVFLNARPCEVCQLPARRTAPRREQNCSKKQVAETERFELSVQMYPYDGLANRWFQPLTHVSGSQQRARPIARAGRGGKGALRGLFGGDWHGPDSSRRKSDSAHRRFIVAAAGLALYSRKASPPAPEWTGGGGQFRGMEQWQVGSSYRCAARWWWWLRASLWLGRLLHRRRSSRLIPTRRLTVIFRARQAHL